MIASLVHSYTAFARRSATATALGLLLAIGTLRGLCATTLAPASKEIGDGRVTYSILISSDAAWTASTTASWVSFSAASGVNEGNLLITAEPNATASSRTATIVIDGQTHTLTQRAFGSSTRELWGMGENNYGQIGDNRLLHRFKPQRVATGATAIMAGFRQTFYKNSSGTFFATGDSNLGKLGDGQSGSPRSSFAPVPELTTITGSIVATTPIRAVATGLNNTYFINSLNTLYGVGSSSSGQLAGTPTTFSPAPLASDVSSMAVGSNSLAYIKSDGTLWTVGLNSDGQLGDGTLINRAAPHQVATQVAAVAGGSWHFLYVKTDGTLWGMGRNSSGQLGDGTNTSRSSPVQITTGVSHVFAASTHSFFIKTDGTLWAMGNNADGQLGIGTTATNSTVPVQIASSVTSASLGSEHSLFLKTDGTLWAMGSNETGALGLTGIEDRRTPVQISTGVSAVAAGSSHTVYLNTAGEVWTMGETGSGQLGDNLTLEPISPVQLATDVREASVSLQNGAYVSNSGQLFTVGYAVFGNLADSTVADRSQFQNAGTAAQVSTGTSHTLILKADQTLWGVGVNSSGEIGTGGTGTVRTPVQITTAVRTMAAGGSHSLFIKTDGTLWAMGDNSKGQLGDGTTTDRTLPVLIASGVASIAAGYESSYFIKNDGTLWAMGENSLTQLGDGTTIDRATPVLIATHASQVAAGYAHALYVKTDGMVMGMGSRSNGALGTNVSGAQVPFTVSNARAVAAGFYFSAILTRDGALWMTGDNTHGQLGIGNTISQTSPVHVASNVESIHTSGFCSSFMFVAKGQIAPGVPRISSLLQDYTITAGQNFSLTATANSALSVNWRWQVSSDNGSTWSDVAGATTSTLTLTTGNAQNGHRYRAVATNSQGSSVTNAATLTVAPRVFPNPAGIVADSTGNLYVSDGTTNTVRKVTPTGESTILAGATGEMGSADGTGTSARFRTPGGLALDSAGNLYVADTGNSTIRKITPAGVVTTLAGSANSNGSADGTGAAARFSGPADLAIASDGTLYVADSGNHTIRQITPTGVVTTLAGLAGTQGSADGDGNTARFNNPRGISVDTAGKIYVGDTTNNTVRAITLSPVNVTTLAGLSGVTNASMSASLTLQTLANPSSTPRPPLLESINNTDPAVANILLNGPTGLMAVGTQSLRLADTGNSTLLNINLTQNTATRIGLDGVAGHRDGASPMFTNPRDITIDTAGNLYVADTGNSAIRKITPDGTASTLIITEAVAPPSGGNPGGGGTTPPPPTNSGGGGGGGAPSAWFFLCLTALSFVRWHFRQRAN